jgi:hypothetical protein
MKLSVLKYCLIIVVAFLFPLSGQGAAYKACSNINTRHTKTITKPTIVVETDFEETTPVSITAVHTGNPGGEFKIREYIANLFAQIIAVHSESCINKARCFSGAQSPDFVPNHILLLFPKHSFW